MTRWLCAVHHALGNKSNRIILKIDQRAWHSECTLVSIGLINAIQKCNAMKERKKSAITGRGWRTDRYVDWMTKRRKKQIIIKMSTRKRPPKYPIRFKFKRLMQNNDPKRLFGVYNVTEFWAQALRCAYEPNDRLANECSNAPKVESKEWGCCWWWWRRRRRRRQRLQPPDTQFWICEYERFSPDQCH